MMKDAAPSIKSTEISLQFCLTGTFAAILRLSLAFLAEEDQNSEIYIKHGKT
jgi:hypothetical protein